MVDFLIAAGHTPSGTIGSGAADLIDESNCTREVAPLVVKYLVQLGYTAELLVFNRGNYSRFEDCHTRADWANKIGGNVFAEIHFNSGMNRRDDGTEVCVTGNNSNANALGTQVSSAIAEAMGINDRGLRTEPGLIVLKETSMAAILIECMFVDGYDANNRYDADKLAIAIVKGLTGQTVSNRKLGWNPSGSKWWYCTALANGYYYTARDGWKQLGGDWYIFDEAGYALQDKWHKDPDGKWYYLGADCKMVKGIDSKTPTWKWIKGECYAFDPSGAMYSNCVTPDGYTVNIDGDWDETKAKIVK